MRAPTVGNVLQWKQKNEESTATKRSTNITVGAGLHGEPLCYEVNFERVEDGTTINAGNVICSTMEVVELVISRNKELHPEERAFIIERLLFTE